MNFPNRWRIWMGLGVALVFVWLPLMTRAFAVTPALVDLQVDPGIKTTRTLQVTNTTGEPRIYVVSVRNFVPHGEEGQQDFLPESDRRGLASWIVPSVQEVILAPGETRDIAYVVNIPKDAPPGGYFAAIFFTLQPTGGRGSSVGVGMSAGVLHFVRVSGEIHEAARIESFRVSDGWTNRLPAQFELRVRNLGNVHLQPEGRIVVRHLLGWQAADIEVNPNRAMVLPSSVRRIETAWSKTPTARTGGFMAELKNEWDQFAFGRYTAQVEGVYGDSRQPMSAMVNFWVVPWRVLLVAGIGAFLLLILAHFYRRRVVRVALEKRAGKTFSS